MGVYITGDKHARFNKLLSFIEIMELTESDTVIVLGDMGLYWRKDKRDSDAFIKFYEENYKANLYWLPGNHENYDLIKELPKEIKNNNAHEEVFRVCSPHIKMLERGYYFEIEGKWFFAMGGANSIDKEQRIIFEKNEGCKCWWEEENITQEDLTVAACNFMVSGQTCDYVLTHAAPISVVNEFQYELCTLKGMDENKIDRTSELRLEELKNALIFDKWYFGHYHIDKKLNSQFTCVYNDFIKVV